MITTSLIRSYGKFRHRECEQKRASKDIFRLLAFDLKLHFNMLNLIMPSLKCKALTLIDLVSTKIYKVKVDIYQHLWLKPRW